MKKLILLSLILIPLFSLSQTSGKSIVITTKGEVIEARITSYINKEIVFSRNVKSLGTNSISIFDVSKIYGDMPKSRIEAILSHNPDVQIAKSLSDPYANQDPIYSQPIPLTRRLEPSAGDLIKRSAAMRLSSYALSTLTSTLIIADVFPDEKVMLGVAIGSSLISTALFLGSEFTLIQAGNKMNRDAVTIAPAQQGLGLAIKF